MGVWLIVASPASALPLLSLDVDLDMPGVQVSRTVLPGESFSVAVFGSGFTEAMPLQGFEFDLDYEPSILEALSVDDGGFLLTPLQLVERDLVGPDVNFALITIGPAGRAGEGVLATLGFRATLPGSVALDLNDVILIAPFGRVIEVERIDGAVINVIPEPGAAPLTAAALISLGISRVLRRWRRRTAGRIG